MAVAASIAAINFCLHASDGRGCLTLLQPHEQHQMLMGVLAQRRSAAPDPRSVYVRVCEGMAAVKLERSDPAKPMKEHTYHPILV